MDDSKKLYIIAGPNGAGKTTASYTVLPEILECQEFVNADEIARGLSPFDPHKAVVAAGKVMLQRIEQLLAAGRTFAIETTLSPRTYRSLVRRAQSQGYSVHLLFFWLESVKMAKMRVAMRVKEGGHDIAAHVIERRYNSGLENLFQIYMPIVDYWAIYNNSLMLRQCVAEGGRERATLVQSADTMNQIENYVGQRIHANQ